jgi:hypothetical protein
VVYHGAFGGCAEGSVASDEALVTGDKAAVAGNSGSGGFPKSFRVRDKRDARDNRDFEAIWNVEILLILIQRGDNRDFGDSFF